MRDSDPLADSALPDIRTTLSTLADALTDGVASIKHVGRSIAVAFRSTRLPRVIVSRATERPSTQPFLPDATI